MLEIRTEQRYDVYDLFLQYPPPLVPRYLRFPVNERTDRDGNILRITTEFDRAPSSYEAVILCGNPTATPGALLDSDGDGSMECRGGVGGDCDTDARPAWFLGFGPEYTPAEFPIVPWAGKAWLPYPGTPPDTIIEYYKIPS